MLVPWTWIILGGSVERWERFSAWAAMLMRFGCTLNIVLLCGFIFFALRNEIKTNKNNSHVTF
jgi:hypothetical protein